MSNPNPIPCDDIPALREIHLRLIDEFARVCEKHQLKYWLEFGTLLGAYREKNFIPWDDDMDISMPIDDYNKFLKVANSELPSDLFVQNFKTDPEFKQYFTKIRHNNSTFIERHEDHTTKYHQGVFIDIFPVMEYPKLPTLLRKVLFKMTVNARYDYFVRNVNYIFNFVFYWLLKAIWWLISLLPKTHYGHTPEDNGYMALIPLSALYPLKEIELAGKFFPAPNDIPLHLSSMYGNGYMTPTPQEKRVSHSQFVDPHTPYKIYRAKTYEPK